MKLFVTGLPYDMDQQDFSEMFELYGNLKSAKLIIDYQTRKSKGFGFVEYVKESDAIETMNLLNGVTIDGKPLKVQPAEDRQRD